MAIPNQSQLRQVAALIDAGDVAVTVSETFPLDNVRDALARVERGGIQGKVVLTTGATQNDAAG